MVWDLAVMKSGAGMHETLPRPKPTKPQVGTCNSAFEFYGIVFLVQRMGKEGVTRKNVASHLETHRRRQRRRMSRLAGTVGNELSQAHVLQQVGRAGDGRDCHGMALII